MPGRLRTAPGGGDALHLCRCGWQQAGQRRRRFARPRTRLPLLQDDSKLYKNNEIANLIVGLGLGLKGEDSPSLRYGKASGTRGRGTRSAGGGSRRGSRRGNRRGRPTCTTPTPNAAAARRAPRRSCRRCRRRPHPALHPPPCCLSSALPGHHPDGCRRGRRPHPHPAAHLPLPLPARPFRAGG